MPDVEDILFPVIQTVGNNHSVPVKFPNRNGPHDASVWIEVVHIPNGPSKSGWNDLNSGQGILNVGVHVPVDTGSQHVTAIQSDLLSSFEQGTLLFDTGIKVEIYTPPVVMAAFEDRQKSVFPVSIRYRSFEN